MLDWADGLLTTYAERWGGSPDAYPAFAEGYGASLADDVMEKIGKPIVFNICMLGAVVGLTDLVKPESIMKVLEQRIPSGFIDMNRQALQLGVDLAKAARS